MDDYDDDDNSNLALFTLAGDPARGRLLSLDPARSGSCSVAPIFVHTRGGNASQPEEQHTLCAPNLIIIGSAILIRLGLLSG